MDTTTDQQLFEAYTAGTPLRQMVLIFAMSETSIRKRVRKAGLPSRNDLTHLLGKRFGKLLVTKKEPSKADGCRWRCICECGREVIKSTTKLKDSKSCGCIDGVLPRKPVVRHGMTAKGSRNPKYKMYYAARSRALTHNLPFEIDLDDITIPEFCPVFPDIRLQHNNDYGRFNSPTLDRIVPSLGYVKGNVIVISKKANGIKQDATAMEIRQVADWLSNLQSR